MDQPAFQRINDSLFAFIRRKVKDEHTAHDIKQEVFVKMQTRLSQLKDPDKLLPWLFRIASNTINDHFRKKQIISDLPEDLHPIVGAPADPGDQEAYLAGCVPSFLETLPEKYQDALRKVEIEGLSQKSYAEQLGISYSGAKSRVQRGREQLKKALLQCCEIATDPYGNVLDYQPRKKCSSDNC